MSSLTLYQVENMDDIAGLEEAISELNKIAEIKVEQIEVSAVVGELAGVATDIILSVPVQLTLGTYTIGHLLWEIITLMKNAGKYLRVGKDAAKAIIAYHAGNDIKKEHTSENIEFENSRIYGPMEADPRFGVSMSCLEGYDQATSPIAYFVGVVMDRPNQRSKTLWYLLGSGGNLCSSWSTQTFTENLPNFMK